MAALAAAAIAWLWLFAYPMPAARLSITTADINGAYHHIATEYAEFFASHGVKLDVQTSAGSQENLDRLSATSTVADLALMQGGFGYLSETAEKRQRSRIETLANVNMEAVWIFTKGRTITSLSQLQGMRVAVGPELSGSRKVALRLLGQARIDPKDMSLSPLTGLDAVQALRQGVVDGVFLVSARDSSIVQNMLNVPGLQLANLQKTAAITERNPYLETSLLPQGALEARVPARDTVMLTLVTSLVTREALHPALKRLAIAAATDTNNKGGLFHRAGEFPSLRRIDFPTSPMSRMTLARGLPWHEEVLPFWWAQFAERMVLLVVPIVLLAVWLMQRIPAAMRWTLQSRVNRWYGELKFIENDLNQQDLTGLDLARFASRLNSIDMAVLAFHCPKDLAARCYTLHQHIEFVRQRLYRMRGR